MICTLCERKYYEGMGCPLDECPMLRVRQPCPPKDDHFTFPDDPEVEARPGWGIFKFDFLVKWGILPQAFVTWHDNVTSICSIAQKIGLTNEQINDVIPQQLAEHGWIARRIGTFLVKVDRYFYEGKLK